jgi:hypothetical protein
MIFFECLVSFSLIHHSRKKLTEIGLESFSSWPNWLLPGSVEGINGHSHGESKRGMFFMYNVITTDVHLPVNSSKCACIMEYPAINQKEQKKWIFLDIW